MYVVMGQSQFTVVLAFKLFSFLSYMFIVLAKCCNCTMYCSHREIHCGHGPTTTKCVALCV